MSSVLQIEKELNIIKNCHVAKIAEKEKRTRIH
jgi:hypothetical protein